MESRAAERGAPDGLRARAARVADGSCGLGGDERGRRLPSAVRHHRGSEPLSSLPPPGFWFFFSMEKKKKLSQHELYFKERSRGGKMDEMC